MAVAMVEVGRVVEVVAVARFELGTGEGGGSATMMAVKKRQI